MQQIADMSLTNVDRKIEHVDEEYGKDYRNSVDSWGLLIDTKDVQKISYDLLCPRQAYQRDYGCNGTPDDERSSLAPSRSRSVTLDSDIRLDQRAGQRSSYPYKS